MKLETLHSVGDKSVYDALCQTTKVKAADFRELFLRRGTICSLKTEKKDLAAYFATMIHDFNDYAMLSDLLGTSSNREKSTYASVKSSASTDDIKSAASSLKNELEDSGSGMVAQVKWHEYGLKIDVAYKEFNPNKNEFSQYVAKVATIVVENNDGVIKARHPDNPKMKLVADSLLEKIGSEAKEEIEPDRISLYEISEPEQRNEFFISLIDEVVGYNSVSVTDVSLYCPKSRFDPANIPSGDLDDEGDGLAEDIPLGTRIFKASFKGQDILKSKDIKEWYAKGFYISKISWRALKRNDPTEGQYVLEAGMSDPENFTGFNYMVKGNCAHHGGDVFADKWKKLDAADERQISNRIEDAGNIVARKLLETFRETEQATSVAIDTAQSKTEPGVEAAEAPDSLETTTEQPDGTL